MRSYKANRIRVITIQESATVLLELDRPTHRDLYNSIWRVFITKDLAGAIDLENTLFTTLYENT